MILAYRPRRAGGWVPLIHVGLDRTQADSRKSKREDDRVLSGLGVCADSNDGQALIGWIGQGSRQGREAIEGKDADEGAERCFSGYGRGRRKED